MADEDAPSPSGLNLGGAISEKLTETIKNMDVMSVLQKMIATTPEDEDSEEIRQKLQGVMAQFNSMSESDKEAFAAKIKEGLASKIRARLTDPNTMNLSGLEEAISEAVMNQLYIMGAVLVVIIFLIGT